MCRGARSQRRSQRAVFALLRTLVVHYRKRVHMSERGTHECVRHKVPDPLRTDYGSESERWEGREIYLVASGRARSITIGSRRPRSSRTVHTWSVTLASVGVKAVHKTSTK